MSGSASHFCQDELELKRLELDADLTYLRFLIADLRCRLERKAGFNPDQPRDDHGRWTDTGAGDGEAPAFSPDKAGWHDYTAGPNVVCTADERCSREEIADHLSRFAVPGQDPRVPSENGKTYPVYDPITGIYAGNVDTTITPDGLSVTNRTLENHIFFDGQITRFATQNADGSWSVTTRGTGNNQIFGMSVANQYGGPVVFDILDERMRENIRVHHGSRKSVSHRQPRADYGSRALPLGAAVAAGGRHAH